MREKIAAYIGENGLIPRGSAVVAGVSGGADSVALLRVLTLLAPEMGFSVYAAHLHHGIRGKSADEDEAYVAELCERLSVPLCRERADIPRLAREHSHTAEQEGRIVRYAFLERAREHFHADFIAVAHHADDQAESVLMHLMRGSGLAGLTGMRAKRGDLIRPLLCVRRSEIEAFLEEEGIPFRTDETNLVPEGTRNRARLEIIPYIEKHINPAFTETLNSTAELLRRDEDYLSLEARRALDLAAREGGYDRQALAELPVPLQARAVRMALADAGAAVDIERAHVERVREHLGARTGAVLQLPGAEVRVSYGLVFFEKPGKKAREEFELPLIVPGVTKTPDGEFHAVFAGDVSVAADPYIAFFDADRLPPFITVRRRRPGDRFHPLGAPGGRKLKECFIDRKLPREMREVPLIVSGAEVFFAPGYGIAEAAKVTSDTTRVLRVEYILAGHKGGAV